MLGLATIFVSLQHLDGHEMTTFMAWAQGIFTFDPNAAGYIANAAPIFKLHLFLGLTIFLVFPRSRQLGRGRRTLPAHDGPVAPARNTAESGAARPAGQPAARPAE